MMARTKIRRYARQAPPTSCPSVPRPNGHYVAPRAKVIEDHPHDSGDGAPSGEGWRRRADDRILDAWAAWRECGRLAVRWLVTRRRPVSLRVTAMAWLLRGGPGRWLCAGCIAGEGLRW